jgi:thioredoxin reductase
VSGARIEEVDAVIVGGGPAGLSAALVLGRCRRRVVLFDDGRYRNASSHALHGFLTRDGVDPAELRRLGRAELARYPSVALRTTTVVDASRDGDRFLLRAADGECLRARSVLLATGLVDAPPPFTCAADLWGSVVFQCPYCDGWEQRDRPLAVYARADDDGAKYAIEVSQWSRDILFCCGGEPRLSDEQCARLQRRGIAVEPRELDRIERHGGGIRLIFTEGPPIDRAAIFFHLGLRPRGDLALRLGCELDERGGVKVTRYEATCVPRLYVAGDASRDVLQAVVASGEGAAAAVMMNLALIETE